MNRDRAEVKIGTKTWFVTEPVLDKILSMAASALSNCDDRSKMEDEALTVALKLIDRR